jgi:uncharacterized membrane protein YgcG
MTVRKTVSVCIAILLLCALAVPAFAAADAHILDDAGLLTPLQLQELEALAREITEEYEIGIYILTAPDYHTYGEEPQIYDVLWNYYHDNDLGYGADRQGMILMLSMAERDFATFFYGEATEYAFNGYGQRELENHFLDNFGADDWYGGFRDFLEHSADYMERAEAGDPVRDDPRDLMLLFVLIALFISFIVTRIMWMKMGNVAAQKGASGYKTAEGLMLTHSRDQFMTRNVIRRNITAGSSGSASNSVAHTGGGGSGRSGKF